MPSDKSDACVIIPARWSSSRFPGKPLALIMGTPMILWVAKLSADALGKQHVYIATDDSRIGNVVSDAGYQVIYTSEDCATGTDRVAEAASTLDYKIYINVQGDEPLCSPSDIREAVKAKQRHPKHVINGFTYIQDGETPESLSIPKFVTDAENNLLYASRALIPSSKSGSSAGRYKKQVCIYAFDMRELLLFRQCESKTPLEEREDIEILRFLEMGMPVKTYECHEGSIAVDHPEDVDKVENNMRLGDSS